MPLPSEWLVGNLTQVLVYGSGKVGKTWGAYTFPRAISMDFDRGIAVMRNPEFVKKHGLNKLVFYEHFKERDMASRGVPKSHNGFDDACLFFDEWMKPSGFWTDRTTGKRYSTGREQFDTWIIDSGTTLSILAVYKAIILLGAKKLSQTHADAMASGLIIPRIQDYGSERSLVEQFVDMILSSGKNVVFICHEKEVTDDQGSVIRIEPLLTGKSSEVVPLKFDEVYNLRVRRHGDGLKRTLLTVTDGVRKAGSRYGIPNDTEWTYDALQKAMSTFRGEQDTLTALRREPDSPVTVRKD